MSRERRHQEAAQAARRLTARVVDGGPAAGGWVPSGDDEPFGWFGPDDGSQRPVRRPPDPPDAVSPRGADPPRLGPGPVRASDLAAASAAGSAGSPVDRWREYAADRVPVALRGAARVPVTAAVAVLLLVAALVGGAVLRAAAADDRVVDVGPLPERSAAAAGTSQPVGSAPAPASAVTTATTSGTGAPTVTAAAGVVVDVVGKVRRPGLVRLPPGSRVADAVSAAGGPTDAAALVRINLARLLADGEQVLVPDRDDPLPAQLAAPTGASSGAGGPGGSTAPAGPLDLNAATAADLDGLPGVGPVIAGRIVAWRSEHQRFSRVDELAEVEGIGPKLLERLRPLVRV